MPKQGCQKNGYTVDLNIREDWGDGFNGEFVITNTTNEPIENWELTFNANFTINNSWAASIINDNNGTYTLKGTYNKVIGANSSISVGFGGTKSNAAAISNVVLTEIVIGEVDIDYSLDTDKDGLPDYLEKLLGTNTRNPDTDGDNLPDGYEIFILITDPLKTDTDDNGILDGDEDFDEDGLANLKEFTLNTDPNKPDTDGDGINDGDEVNVYDTDPLNPDTDNDSITDFEEITLGLDPNNPMTDGVTHDSLRTFYQTLSYDSISEELTSSDNWLIPSVSGYVPGLISNRLGLESSSFDAFYDNRALISKVISVETAYDVPFTLTFSYADSSVNYSGDIKNLFIFNYDDELVLCDTVIDTKNSTISATINGAGDYFVLDLNEFLKGLGIDVLNNLTNPTPILEAFSFSDRIITETNIPETITLYDNYGEPVGEIPNPELKSTNSNFISIAPMTESFSAYSIDNTGSNAMGKADIVFVIDTTGSMGGVINNVKNNVNTFADKLVKEYNIDANFALVEFQDITCDGVNSTFVHKNGTSNWYTDVNQFKSKVSTLVAKGGGDEPETAIDGLEMARRLDFRSNADKFVILITDASYKTNNRYGITSMAEMTNLLINDGITTSVICYNESLYRDLYTKTDGLYGYIYDNFSSVLLRTCVHR